MIKAMGVIAVSIAIILYEIPSLLESNSKREIWIFSILLVVGTVFGVLLSLGINITTPLEFLATILNPFYQFIESIFSD